MAVDKISYSARTYDDFRRELLNLTQQHYPEVFAQINDASVGQWLVDIISDMGDALSYHIDRTFQETNIDSAQELKSLKDIARTNGLKLPGRKAALCEVKLSCQIPVDSDSVQNLSLPNYEYAPIVKVGTQFSTGSVTFELLNDCDFSQQFNQDGISDRTITPIRDSNGAIRAYKLTKLAIVTSGITRVYKKIINSSDIKPFMEVILQDNNILGVESVILKEGTNLTTNVLTSEFFVDSENQCKDINGKTIYRFFEVDNLIEQRRFGDIHTEQVADKIVNEVVADNDGSEITVRQYYKGKWQPLKQKFTTEYDAQDNLVIRFGAGIENEYGQIPDTAEDFTQGMMSRMFANDAMGVLPRAGYTMYIRYRVGGGEETNIAQDTLTNIVFQNYELGCGDAKIKKQVLDSIRVTNTSPSYGGRDALTAEEIRQIAKYNNASQKRCVTLKDYIARVADIPARYGCPFRVGGVEENNKIVLYTLGLDSDGKLTKELAEIVGDNMIEYLSEYKMITDLVEVRSGRIINLGFDVTVYIDKSYDKAEVAKRVIDSVYEYMDIEEHVMGDEVFVGDLQRKIANLDGILNVTKIQVYNKLGDEYSDDEIQQTLVVPDCSEGDEMDNVNADNEVDLEASDMILFNEPNSMFEIKFKEKDIKVFIKTR